MEKIWAMIKLIAINWKTTVAAALITIIVTLNDVFGLNLNAQQIITTIGAIMALALLFTRDVNVTSEGTKVTQQRIENGEAIEAAEINLVENMYGRSINDVKNVPLR